MYKPLDVILPIIYGLLLLILAFLIWHFIHPVVSILVAGIGSYLLWLKNFFRNDSGPKNPGDHV